MKVAAAALTLIVTGAVLSFAEGSKSYRARQIFRS